MHVASSQFFNDKLCIANHANTQCSNACTITWYSVVTLETLSLPVAR